MTNTFGTGEVTPGISPLSHYALTKVTDADVTQRVTGKEPCSGTVEISFFGLLIFFSKHPQSENPR